MPGFVERKQHIKNLEGGNRSYRKERGEIVLIDIKRHNRHKGQMDGVRAGKANCFLFIIPKRQFAVGIGANSSNSFSFSLEVYCAKFKGFQPNSRSLHSLPTER